MCKSANERGGPYRCPGDMQKKVATALDEVAQKVETAKTSRATALDAQAALIKARDLHDAAITRQGQRRHDPDAPWRFRGTIAPARDHIGTLVDSGELPESARRRPAGQVFDAYARTHGIDEGDPGAPDHAVDGDIEYLRRVRATVDSLNERDLAQARFDYARDRFYADNDAVAIAQTALTEARADYHSTPRGLGELMADHDRTREHGDPIAAAALHTQVATASARANAEASRRYDGALSRGEDAAPYAYQLQPLHTQDPDDERTAGAAWLAKRDRIAGTARIYDQDKNPRPTSVTLTRSERGQIHEATFDVPHGQPATVAGILGALATDKAHLDSAPDFDEWHRTYAPSGTENDRARARLNFAAARANAERLERFLGADRASEYVDVHTRGRRPALASV